MKAFTIPSVYTAVDKYTSPLRKMGAATQSFANGLQSVTSYGERAFRKLTPVFSESTKQLLSFAKSAVLAGLVVSGVHFSIDSIKQYETAVQSFRTIVSDLSDKDFSKFQNKINEVAKDTKTSSIAVAESFEKIAGLNADFAKTSIGIGQVSKAAIILSKASRSDLGESAENLVGIMNQFSFAADQAGRTIDVLAAGQAVGAANINQTAQAFVNFGSVAAGSNITLEQSVGLIQTLGKFSIFGAEAGTKLRGAILKLQKAGVGYKSGQFQINDALAEAKKKIDVLKTAKQKDALLNKMFGAENVATGRTLLANINTYKSYSEAVKKRGEAEKAASVNSKTLTVMLGQLSAGWVNLITSSDKATSSLSTVKNVIGFVTENLDTIVSISSKILLFFIAWKAILIVSSLALGAYNIVLGITGALTGIVSLAVGKSAIAMKAYRATLAIATAAQWLWNAALMANPIGLIIIGVAALIALIVVVIKKWNEWGAALSLFMGPLGLIISMIQSFRRNWDMITQAFKSGGILSGLKAIGKTILDAVLMPIQQVLKIIENVTGFEWASKAVANIEAFRKDLGVNVTTDEGGNALKKEAINPKLVEKEVRREEIKSMQTYNSKLTIEDKSGRGTLDNENPGIMMPKLSSTLGF